MDWGGVSEIDGNGFRERVRIAHSTPASSWRAAQAKLIQMIYIRTHYLDAFALVKLLIDEDGSAAVRSYLGPHAIRRTTSLCFAETLGVLKAKHERSRISDEQYLASCEELMAHVRAQTYI